MNKVELIQKITPLYNLYKQEKKHMIGTDMVKIMWGIGDHLKSYIDEHKIKPHSLFREIYGKSEGKKNIKQKSYITREFQSRCYRIRKMFESKEKIAEDLPTLKAFTPFREAMPFFDNPKYKLEGEEKAALLKILNSNLKASTILKKIKALQAQKINIKNPRTQRLKDQEEIKENFIEFYNAIYRLIEMRSYEDVLSSLGRISSEYVKVLARNTDSLSQEGLKSYEFAIPEGLDDLWKAYSENVKYLLSQDDAKARRRFRRLIKPERIARLADMLFALSDKNIFERFS